MVAVFGAGIQCQFTQQEEKSLRWCVCVCGRSARALRFSNGEVRWCVQYSIHQGRSDYDFLINSFVFVLLEICLLYPMPLHKTFCPQGRITLQTPRQDGLVTSSLKLKARASFVGGGECDFLMLFLFWNILK
jgi:hypothetical protein